MALPNFLVASPGLNPSTRQKLLALQAGGMLHTLVTTFAVGPGDPLLKRLPGTRSRWLDGIEPARLRRRPWLELARWGASRVDPTGVLTDLLWEAGDLHFARAAGRDLEEVQAVLGFEHSSLELFLAARAKGLRAYYDVPSAHSGLIQTLLAPIYAEFPALRTAYRVHTTRIEARRQARRDREFELADRVIAHSSFCKRSYVEAGFPAEKIHVVPYGAAPPDPAGDPCAAPERPSFLFAGNVAPHKGILTLWEAWRRLGDSRARLRVAGEVLLPPEMMKLSPPGVEYLGRVRWTELRALYRGSTALVFPTLSDGFGMVVTEAMAHGLPVITTPHAGASDLIRDGENGLLVPILDPEALAGAMASLSADPGRVAHLREASRKAAAAWPWSAFRAAFVQALLDPDHGP